MNDVSNAASKSNRGGGTGGPELKAVKELAKSLEDRVDTLEYDYKKHSKQTEENTDNIETMKGVAAKRSARKDKSPKPTSSRVEFKAAQDTGKTNKTNLEIQTISSAAPGISAEQLEEMEADILAKADDAVNDKMDEVFTSISDMEIKLKKLIV